MDASGESGAKSYTPRPLCADACFDTFAVQGQLADPMAGRIGDRIGERGGGGALRRFANAEEGLAGPVDDLDLDAARHVREAQDRIAAPVAARDPALVEGDRLERRPAERLQDAAFDLVADAVRVYRLA